jgi:hypothetical protein
MAVDVDKLGRTIRDYATHLDKHREEVTRDFEALDKLFARLFANYGGKSSAELQANWRRTAEWFADYTRATGALSRHLAERSTHLDKL